MEKKKVKYNVDQIIFGWSREILNTYTFFQLLLN